MVAYIGEGGYGDVLTAFGDGAVTFVRVVVLVAFATVVWVPIGVWIGFNPRVARIAQPIVQILASFPANFLFPFATAAFIAVGVSLNVGGILLMSLGAQWYILFNTIAGAMAVPTDLREAAAAAGLQRLEALAAPDHPRRSSPPTSRAGSRRPEARGTRRSSRRSSPMAAPP